MERLNPLTFDLQEGACNTFKDSTGMPILKTSVFIVRFEDLGPSGFHWIC